MKDPSNKNSDFFWTIRFFAGKNPELFVMSSLLSGLHGIINIMGAVWLLYYVVDAIEQSRQLIDILAVFVLYVVVATVYYVLNRWFATCRKPLLYLSAKEKFAETVAQKLRYLPYREYESAETYDDLQRVRGFSETAVFKLFESYLTLIKDVVMLVSGVLSAVAIDPYILCFIVLAFPSVIIGKKYGKKSGEEQVKNVRPSRLSSYVLSTFLSRSQQRVIRSSAAGAVLRQYYEKSVDTRKELIIARSKKLSLLSALYVFLSVDFISIVVYLYAILRVMYGGTVSIAAFSVLVTATMTVVSRTRKILDFVSVVARYRVDIQKFREFLLRSVKMPTTELDSSFRSVEFRDVTFSYDCRTEVLNDISFGIKRHEKIAIVGYNGAGKTTLIKLMLGLYPVTNGEILINGVPVSQISQQSLRKLFGVMFQDFYLFNMRLQDNLCVSCTDEQPQVSDTLMKRAGLSYTKDDLLREYGRVFDENGIVPSGGQSQRLAFARLLNTDAEIWVLDEPTASLDPIAEETLYQDILSESNDKNSYIYIAPFVFCQES